MKRADQIDGMKRWHKRGNTSACHAVMSVSSKGSGPKDLDQVEIADACIRCEKGGEDGTMGFFVAGFVREGGEVEIEHNGAGSGASNGRKESDDDEEWNGFSDNED